jgi:acetate kinase
VEVAGHDEATRLVLDWLAGLGAGGPGRPDAVGHRVVHGGDRFVGPALIDDKVIEEIEALGELAPLHNLPALDAIRAARAILGPSIPMVATFDTAFHRSLPERAARYAIPPELAEKHRVYRYGFHGLAHRYMAERCAALSGRPIDETKLITLQLGNGCSATAIDGGLSIDTSMGFTPLEGLVMGTRSGDIDPSVIGYLACREGVAPEEVEHRLNTASGLQGISGRSHDMRELLQAESRGDARAALAVETFCYRARKYVGAYLAALGGADALVFGGGIGENAPVVRSRICDGLEWCGLTLDPDRNERTTGSERTISAEGSKVQAYVIAVDEEVVIARDTERCLRGES